MKVTLRKGQSKPPAIKLSGKSSMPKLKSVKPRGPKKGKAAKVASKMKVII